MPRPLTFFPSHLAVTLLPDPFPPDAVLQSIAAENNLSETAFWRKRKG